MCSGAPGIRKGQAAYRVEYGFPRGAPPFLYHRFDFTYETVYILMVNVAVGIFEGLEIDFEELTR